MTGLGEDDNYHVEHDEETQSEITNAISQILLARRNNMVTKLIVIAEIIDSDGDRAMWTSTSPGMTSWDEAGMLDHAKDKVSHHMLLVRLSQLDKNDEEE